MNSATSESSSPRILMIGDMSPFGAASQYRAALQGLGATVVHQSDWLGLEHIIRKNARGILYRIARVLLPDDLAYHEKIILKECRSLRPHLIINVKGLHWRRTFVDKLRATRATVILINHDDFFSRYRSVRSVIQRSAIPAYDRILTTRRINVEELNPINPNVEFFPFAYSPSIHRRIQPTSDQIGRLSSDVVFIGTFARHRVQMMERLMSLYPCNLKIHGGSWEKLSKRSTLQPLLASSGLFDEDMSAAFNLSKVALGFLRKENRDEYTQRSFEIPACGGVLLTERTPTHQLLYREGVEAEFFDSDSPEELCCKVKRLIDDDEYRETMRKAGEIAVHRGGNTYKDRAERLLTILREYQPELCNSVPGSAGSH